MTGATITSRAQLARALGVAPESRGRRLLREAATVAGVAVAGGVVLLALLALIGG
jgi:hypothetical protein